MYVKHCNLLNIHMCIFCILEVFPAVVVYAGEPVVVPGDIDVVIDCG